MQSKLEVPTFENLYNEVFRSVLIYKLYHSYHCLENDIPYNNIKHEGEHTMSLFDSFKRQAAKTVNDAVNTAAKAINKVTNHSETFTFQSLPTSLSELNSLPEMSLDSPYKTAALTLAVLCHFEKGENAVYEMLDFLKGPDSLSNNDKQFLKERLSGKYYKPFSFFAGATPTNNYTPSKPYTITVTSNPYSFPEENWATMHLQSSGADSPRQIKLRKKPSTGQWFLNDIQCLSDIRIPAEADPWA